MGRVIISIFSMVVFLFLFLIGLFYFDKENTETIVNDAVYNAVEAASTSGMLSASEFEDMEFNLNKYSTGSSIEGKFFIKIKLEKQLKPGVYDTYYESNFDRRDYKKCIEGGSTESVCRQEVPAYGDVVDRPLSVGDKLTVFAKDNSDTVFGILMNTPVLGVVADEYVDSKMTVMKSGTVTNNKEGIISGYEVIALLNDSSTWVSGQDEIEGQTESYTSTVVTVDTLISDEYTTYTSSGYNESNPSSDEYIFPDGKFLMDYRIEGNTRFYEFTQEY